MRKPYRTLAAIEYAFVCSMIASFSVVVVAGFFFGFELSQWFEGQGRLVGVISNKKLLDLKLLETARILAR